ncbi:MAG: GNAT family N-acetyltransferase [Clostridiales bacterium]|nr:GNAT family N-acetyltransferase [Clostridiales bacterium]
MKPVIDNSMLSDGIVTLRAPEPQDIDMMYLTENDVAQWNDGVTFAPVSRKQLWDYIENYDGNIFATGQLRLVIVHRNEFAGVADLYDYDRVNHRAYVGITVIKSMRHDHVATRALSLLIKLCGEVLGMHQLAAVVRCDNEPSVKLFRNAGFTETGRFTDWIKRGRGYVSAYHFQRLVGPGIHGVE